MCLTIVLYCPGLWDTYRVLSGWMQGSWLWCNHKYTWQMWLTIWITHRRMYYSHLPCAAGLLCAAPPAPSPGQGAHLLLPPGQLSSHAVNMRFDKYTISPCIYAIHIPQYICQCRLNTSVASTAILELLRPVNSDTVSGHWSWMHTHIGHFIKSWATIQEHSHYLSSIIVGSS